MNITIGKLEIQLKELKQECDKRILEKDKIISDFKE